MPSEYVYEEIAGRQVSLASVIGVVGIALLISLTIIFQLTHWMGFDLTQSFTEVWLWILFTGTGVCFTLINYGIWHRRSLKKTQQSIVSPLSQKMGETPKEVSGLSGRLLPEGVEFYASREDMPGLNAFLATAKSEIHFLGSDLAEITVKEAVIWNLLTEGKHLTFVLLHPDSKQVEKLAGDIEKNRETIRQSLTKLTQIKNALDELDDVQKGHLDIKTHDLLPLHSVIAIDPKSGEGMTNVEHYVYGDPQSKFGTDGPNIRVSEKAEGTLYQRYWNSYCYVLKNAKFYPETASPS